MQMLAFFYMFDPMYFVYVGPAILLTIWANAKVKRAYAMGSRFQASSGMTGAQTAQRILDVYGITDVVVEPVKSFLGDHYDPSHKKLRLSPDVYNGRSLVALGIAAHEVGHAIQHATSYAPLALRSTLVPMASLGSNLSIILVIAGMLFNIMNLAIAGLIFFGVVVVFQLVNLPVEFNASSRAREILLNQNMITSKEDVVVGQVLNAAAMTYVAATLTAIMTLFYYASIVLGRRN